MFQFDASCKEGRIQVEDETLRLKPGFGHKDQGWEAPASSVTQFTLRPGGFPWTQVTFHTETGVYQASLAKAEFKKLAALFPTVRAVEAGKEWYCDPALLTHVEVYEAKEEKRMQKEVQEAGRYGWIPQGAGVDSGHMNVGRTAAGAALTGGASLLFGGSRTKGKTTITFIRAR
jgi:hypothetical protein